MRNSIISGQLCSRGVPSPGVTQNQIAKYLKYCQPGHDGKPKDNLVPRYEGIVNGIRDIYAKEGLSGLFKGIHLTTFTSAIASALFFWMYLWINLATNNAS